MYLIQKEKQHFYQASDFFHDYQIKFNGREISFEEYLTTKEQS